MSQRNIYSGESDYKINEDQIAGNSSKHLGGKFYRSGPEPDSHLGYDPSQTQNLPPGGFMQRGPTTFFPMGQDVPQYNYDYLAANPLANVAVQYGSKLVGTGKHMVDKEINRYLPLSLVKFYFTVDTDYVIKKLRLLIFPFANKDWSLKSAEGRRLSPKEDANCPDLYIPLMGYLTYVLLAGVALGIKGKFEPEVLGIISSQALAWTLVEILLQLIAIYFITLTPQQLTSVDILAYSGYKFVGINVILLTGLMTNYTFSWLSFFYFAVTTSFFMVQALKWRLMSGGVEDFQDTQMNSSYDHIEYKRKIYFLVMLAASYIMQMWWLSTTVDKKN